MKLVTTRTLLTLALAAAASSTALAQIPRTISFQGVLADAAGTLVADGPQDLTISIYDASTGGTPLFSETQRVTVVRGVFNAIIGATDPNGIPSTVAFDQQYYLGVRVGTGVELAPRTPFTSVPYALNAAMAERARVADTASFASTAMTADTAIAVRGGHVVSFNGQQGPIEISGAGATTITRSGNQFIIRSTDTSSGGIRRIDNFDGSLVIDPPQGPFVTMFIREQGIQTHHLRDMSVTTAKLALGAIGTNQLADGAVTNPKIATSAVDSRTILDGTIITQDLADNSVTSPKIVDGQVLTQDIGANQVTADRIGTGGAAAGTFLQSDGTATPVWSNDGSQIQNIDATNITLGTLALERIDTAGAVTGQALTFDGAMLGYGYPAADSLVLPLWQTSDAAATLLSLTATHPAAGGASFTNASSNPTLNATNSTGATAINADGTVRINGAAGQAALVVTSGRTVLAAGTVANGAEIAADLTVVSVDDDGIVGGIPSVMLPTAVENGTVMMVSTEDADGALVDGWPIDVLTSRTFVRVNGTWKPNW